MNWFQYFPRDWLAATLQLTCEEDGVYHRLVDWCYVNECELPHDIEECFRIARVQTKSERDAVTRVTRDYFRDTPSGRAQKHIAQKVEKFLLGEPEREARRALDAQRKRRNRAMQRLLYGALRNAGVYARPGMGMRELRESIESAGLSQPDGNVTWRDTPGYPIPPDMLPNDTNGHGASADASEWDSVTCPLVAANHEANTPKEEASASSAGARDGGTRAAKACKAMRQCGLSATNPSDPRLLALLDQGVTDEELSYAAAKAVAEGKRDAWAYALAVVKGQRADAARIALVPRSQSAAAARVAEWAPGLEALP